MPASFFYKHSVVFWVKTGILLLFLFLYQLAETAVEKERRHFWFSFFMWENAIKKRETEGDKHTRAFDLHSLNDVVQSVIVPEPSENPSAVTQSSITRSSGLCSRPAVLNTQHISNI